MASEEAEPVFPCQDELLDLLDLLVDVIFCVKSSDGRYVRVNRAFVRRTGRTSVRDVVGKTAADLFSPALAERYEEQDRRVFETGAALRDELELVRREDGSLGWYVTAKLPVSDRAEPSAVCGLVSISRDLRTPQEDRVQIESLSRVVEHVRAHLREPMRVAELAAVAGCSTSQLERRMRRAFGLTASKYVARTRVDRAAELLADTDMAIADVASAAGFYDQADLTRRFARLTNETPAQFRAIARSRRQSGPDSPRHGGDPAAH